MKKFVSVGLLAGLLLAGNVMADGVVFVDIQIVLKEFYKTKLATDQIQQQTDDIEVEVQEMENEIVEMKDLVDVLRRDSRDVALSEEIRLAKRDELEEKLVDMQKKESEMEEFKRLRKEQLEQQQKRMLLKLLDEVHEAVVQYAKGKGYDGVIDRSIQTQLRTPMVVYAHPNSDITAAVLAALNEGRGAEKESSDAAEKSE